MRALFKFAHHTPEADVFNQLALPDDKRDPAFVQMVNRAALAICGGPANIMMGPRNTQRGDDPGHGRAYARSGLPTPARAVAERMEKSGGPGTPRTLGEDEDEVPGFGDRFSTDDWAPSPPLNRG